MLISVFVCFFKQKTAYELRISDWSSDVCSPIYPPQHVVPIPEMMLQSRPHMDRDHEHKQYDQQRVDAFGPVENPPLDPRRKRLEGHIGPRDDPRDFQLLDRKSTRLNSSH